MIEKILYGFGYLFAFVLFFGAKTPESVVKRLRIAYRLVGVRIKDRSDDDSIKTTVFLCPYRNLFAGRYGKRWICHNKLDRVDDGYVTYLKRHKNIEYERPQGCPNSEYCYSKVSEHG